MHIYGDHKDAASTTRKAEIIHTRTISIAQFRHTTDSSQMLPFQTTFQVNMFPAESAPRVTVGPAMLVAVLPPILRSSIFSPFFVIIT